MNKSTADAAARQAVAEDSFQARCQLLDRQAEAIAESYQNRLQQMAQAHRRARFIDWFDYGEDEPMNELIEAEFALLGERIPDEIPDEEYRAIFGRQYDRMTDDEVRTFEAMVRGEDSTSYFDNAYYSDEMIAVRNQWTREISNLADQARAELNRQYCEQVATLHDTAAYEQAGKRQEWARSEVTRIATQYSPAVFACDACGQHTYSHDECGQLIAGVGLWAMPNGDTGSYMVCETCVGKPETHGALERLFDESAAHRTARDEALALSIPKFLAKPFAEWTEGDRRENERQVDEYVQARMVVLVQEYVDARNDAQPAATGSGSTPGSVGQNTGSQPQNGPQPQTQPQAAGTGFRFEFLTIDDLMSRPAKVWKVGQLIGDREMVVPIGPSGEGKTLATIDLIYAMCLGQQFAGYFDIPRPLTVAYCAGEGLDGLRDRFAAAEAKWRAKLPIDRFVMVPSLPQLYRAGPQHIKAFVDQWRMSGRGAPDVLVLDTFHKASVGVDENSSRDIGIVYDAVKYAVDELGCSTWTPHHTNKGGKDSRGSTAIMADFDSMVRIEKNNGDHVMTAIKIKDAGEWPDLHFKLIAHGDSVYVDWSGGAVKSGSQPSKAQTVRDAVYSLLFKYPTDHFAASGIAGGIGATTNEVNKALSGLLAAGKVDRHKVTGSRNAWEWSLSDPLAAA